MADLLDANVWLALDVESHPHHDRANRFWDHETANEIAFCRVTSQAFLLLLSSQRVLGKHALTGFAAWKTVRTWRRLSQVTSMAEPDGLDDVLGAWAEAIDIRGKHWTDAYLAAFAVASGSRFVTFDSDYGRYPGLSWLHLAAD